MACKISFLYIVHIVYITLSQFIFGFLLQVFENLFCDLHKVFRASFPRPCPPASVLLVDVWVLYGGLGLSGLPGGLGGPLASPGLGRLGLPVVLLILRGLAKPLGGDMRI